MPITEKERKILWARSGNRCALCRVSLIVDRTENSTESVIGEECHIISSAPTGPRHEPSLSSSGTVDTLDNMILLCSVHHKMIDDQYETYSAPVVRSIKKNHESWVETSLSDKPLMEPVRIRRIRKNIPVRLLRIITGKELLAITSGAVAGYYDHGTDLSDDEVELIGGCIQEVKDLIEFGSDMEHIAQIRTAKYLQDMINELDVKGFFVFAAIELQQLEGGVGAPSGFPVLHLAVLRSLHPDIQYDFTDEQVNLEP